MRLLLIRPGALGDTLMLLPSLMELRSRISITFVGRGPGLEYAGNYADAAVDFEDSGWHKLFMEHPDCHELPVSKTDSVVAFLRDQDGRIYRNLKTFFQKAKVHVFPGQVPKGRKIHMALYLADCLNLAGLPIDPARSFENFSRHGLSEKGNSSRKRTEIVFHPGSGDPKKNYPPGFIIELLERIFRERRFRDLKPVVLLGPAEEHLYSFFKANPAMLDGEILLCPFRDELIEHLKNASFYLGHDSGITHLSAMLGTPTIALFKSMKVEQWRPLGPHVEVMNSRKPLAGIIDQVVRAAKALARGDER